MKRDWVTAHHRALAAAKDAQEKFERAFAIGERVEWIHSGRGGDYPQRGIVVMHGAGERLKVWNMGSGNEIWIHDWQLLRILEAT